MALPIIAGLAGQAILHAFSKPWPWIIIGTWFVASHIDLGLLATEFRDTIFRPWWLVAFTIFLLIVLQYIKLLNKKS